MILHGTKGHFHKLVNIFYWLFLKVAVIKLQYLYTSFLKNSQNNAYKPTRPYCFLSTIALSLPTKVIHYIRPYYYQAYQAGKRFPKYTNYCKCLGRGLISELYLQTVHSYTVICIFFLDSHRPTIFMPKSPRFHRSGPHPPKPKSIESNG